MVAQGRSIFLSEPPPPLKDGQFLHKGGRIFKSTELPKNEPFGTTLKGLWYWYYINLFSQFSLEEQAAVHRLNTQGKGGVF